ncbi:MAG: heavy metal-binding domain-containing protein, partial [Bacteroidia bacterium]
FSCRNSKHADKLHQHAEAEHDGHEHEESEHHEHEHEESSGHNHDDGHEHKHVFYCTLHPEIEKEEPGICPKCGAELEFLEDENMVRYSAEFRTEPQKPEAGKTVHLFFKPFLVNKSKQTLELEELPKLMVVNQDFTYIRILKTRTVQNNAFQSDLVVDKNDKYILFYSFKPKNSLPAFSRQELNFAGSKSQSIKLNKEKLVWENNGYKVVLQTGKPFEFNIPTLLKINILLNEKPANHLADAAEMFIIDAGQKKYQPIHQLKQDSSQNTKPAFHTLFPAKGFYKVFFTFTHNNKIQIADFVIEVVE